MRAAADRDKKYVLRTFEATERNIVLLRADHGTRTQRSASVFVRIPL